MPNHIAIIGTGPTGLYTFQHLIETGGAHTISLFEQGAEAGVGMPYGAETATKTMLANIASIEIPPLGRSYLAFLKALPDEVLASFSLKRDELDERSFTPRLLLGRYFRQEFLGLMDAAEAKGIVTRVFETTRIADIALEDGLYRLVSADGQSFGPFDRVVIATGHEFEPDDDLSDLYFPNPWSGLIEADIPAARVGIMGTSLSSIDAAMAVVTQHGRFTQHGEEVSFALDEPSGLSVTLMSRQGILPEADFYCPIPYEPLVYVSEAALAACARGEHVLDRAFELFVRELSEADPDYARQIGLEDLTADSFAQAYFAQRLAQDPFTWARENLAEVERNKRDKVTVGWRYALLRMHEQFETLVPKLSEKDRERFDKGLKRVFIDNYAAVPSESIRRLLALRDAGILRVVGLGEDYSLNVEAEATRITTAGQRLEFDVFIDARGQKALTTAHLPFPTLRKALLAAGQEVPEFGEDYAMISPIKEHGRLYLAAIAYLMHEKPFAQGIVVSNQIGQAVARSIAGARAADE